MIIENEWKWLLKMSKNYYWKWVKMIIENKWKWLFKVSENDYWVKVIIKRKWLLKMS